MLKVSIIIPVYNVEKYLRECLDSITNQTLRDIEIICVNDGSPDNCLEILSEFEKRDSRCKIIHQENQGVACSRNNALNIAQGEYILFVDSDDYLRDDSLELLYNRAKKFDLDMLSYGGTNFADETREILGNPLYEFRWVPNGFNTDVFNYKDCKGFVSQVTVSSCLTMYRRMFIKEYNIEFPPHLCFEDNMFFCKAFMNAKRCGALNETLYFRRVHEGSTTQNWLKHHLDYVKISKLVLDYLKLIEIDDDIYEEYRNTYTNIVVSKYNECEDELKKEYYKPVLDFAREYSPDYIWRIAKPPKFIHHIFSVKNKGIHKVVRFFGLKFSFKCKKLIDRQKIRNLENQLDFLHRINETIMNELDSLKKSHNDFMQEVTIQLQNNVRIQDFNDDFKQ